MSREYTFTVEGEGNFPFDMLRYDRCWPKTATDVGLMKGRALRNVTLLSNKTATNDRWASYGWRIVTERVQ